MFRIHNMSDYERIWCEPKLDSNGRVTIAGGYKYCPVRVDEDLKEFFDKVNAIVVETEAYKERQKRIHRYAKCFVKWFSLIEEYKNKYGISDTISPQTFLDVDKLIDLAIYVEYTDSIDFSTAKKKVLPLLRNNFNEETVWQILERLGIFDKSDSNEVDTVIDEVLSKYPDKVAAYKGGNKNLVGLFMGEIMRIDKVKVNPKELNELIRNKLEA